MSASFKIISLELKVDCHHCIIPVLLSHKATTVAQLHEVPQLFSPTPWWNQLIYHLNKKFFTPIFPSPHLPLVHHNRCLVLWRSELRMSSLPYHTFSGEGMLRDVTKIIATCSLPTSPHLPPPRWNGFTLQGGEGKATLRLLKQGLWLHSYLVSLSSILFYYDSLNS